MRAGHFGRFLLLATLAVVAIPDGVASARKPCGFLQALHEFRAGQSRDRPEAEAYQDSSIHPIRVHYLLEDEDQVADVIDWSEDAWNQQAGDWGFGEPGPDNGDGGSESLDIYLTDIEDAAGYAMPETWDNSDGQSRCSCYVAIDREAGDDDMRQTVHHEFNHVLQMWIDCAEDDQFLEASAVYAEDWVDPSLQAAWHWVPHFQDGYYRSLDYFEYSEPPQYGSFIFPQYLAERFGDGTPRSTRELWHDAVQSDWGNSNTWMDTLERWLADHWNDDVGTPQGDELYTELAWREFSEWRFFLGENDDGLHFEHGWPGQVGLNLELPYMTTIPFTELEGGSLERELRLAMAETSTAAIPIQAPDPGWNFQIELVAESNEDRWALTLFSVGATGDVLDRQVGEIGLASAYVEGTVPPDTRDTILVLANVGDGVLNPNEDDWDREGGVLSITAWTDDPADDDDDDDSADEGADDGCQCAAAGSVAPGAGLLIVGLALLVSRRCVR